MKISELHCTLVESSFQISLNPEELLKIVMASFFAKYETMVRAENREFHKVWPRF